MFVLVRAIVYASLFISLVLVVIPAQVLARFSVPVPEPFAAPQIVGGAVVLVGAAIAVACILAFAFVGKGTPAPFDPPRRLVIRGPYAVVRNPMYIGAGTALAGAALYYESLALAGYVVVFFLGTHLFVVLYEEPVLKRMFGAEYETYTRSVDRWLPRSVRPHRGALSLKVLLAAALSIAIGAVVVALVIAPLYARYDATECHRAYASARSRADTARVDLHPYGKGRTGAARNRRCGEVRAALAGSAAAAVGVARERP